MTGQDDARAQITTEFELRDLKQRLTAVELKLEALQKANLENEKDIWRGRAVLIVLVSLGGIITFILNTLSNIKGFVK